MHLFTHTHTRTRSYVHVDLHAPLCCSFLQSVCTPVISPSFVIVEVKTLNNWSGFSSRLWIRLSLAEVCLTKQNNKHYFRTTYVRYLNRIIISQFNIHVYVLCNTYILIQRSHASAQNCFNKYQTKTNKRKKQVLGHCIWKRKLHPVSVLNN